MKKLIPVICAAFMLPSLANAADVFVWNFDPFDRFYDAEVGDTIDCSYWLERTLNDNGHSVQTDMNLPGDLDPYDVVFVTTGWYRC